MQLPPTPEEQLRRFLFGLRDRDHATTLEAVNQLRVTVTMHQSPSPVALREVLRELRAAPWLTASGWPFWSCERPGGVKILPDRRH